MVWRVKRDESLQRLDYPSALYFGEFIINRGEDGTTCEHDHYQLALIHFHLHQYLSALLYLTNLHSISVCALKARCLEQVEKWESIVTLVEEKEQSARNNTDGDGWTATKLDARLIGNQDINAIISISLQILATAYLNLGNRIKAKLNYTKAFKLDCYNYTSFHLLQTHFLMSSSDLMQLLVSVGADACTLYSLSLPQSINTLAKTVKGRRLVDEKNPLSQLSLIHHHIHHYSFKVALTLLKPLVKSKPHSLDLLHLTTILLYLLNPSSKSVPNLALFSHVHALSETHGQTAESYVAIALYLLTLQRHSEARRYLVKATTVNRAFVDAWLAFGHSFVEEGEFESGVLVYGEMGRLMDATYYCDLFMGMAYADLGRFDIALHNLSTASQKEGRDAIVWNELGVVFYKLERYIEAISAFKTALEVVDESGVDKRLWNGTRVNLGHCYRWIDQDDLALDLFAVGGPRGDGGKALVYIKKGRLEDAMDVLLGLVELDAKDLIAKELLDWVVDENSKGFIKILKEDTYMRKVMVDLTDEDVSEMIDPEEIIFEKIERTGMLTRARKERKSHGAMGSSELDISSAKRLNFLSSDVELESGIEGLSKGRADDSPPRRYRRLFESRDMGSQGSDMEIDDSD